MADVVIPGRGVRATAILRKLQLSTSVATVGVSFVAEIVGATKGSTLTLNPNPGNRYQILDGKLVGYGFGLVAGTDAIGIIETPPSGVVGGSRTTNVVVTVSAPLALSGTIAAVAPGATVTFTPTTTGGSGGVKYSLGAGRRLFSINENTGLITSIRPLSNLGSTHVSINAVDIAGATANLNLVFQVQAPTVNQFLAFWRTGYLWNDNHIWSDAA